MRKPLLAPGAYYKIIDLTSALCGPNKRESDIAYKGTVMILSKFSDLPLNCPVPPVCGEPDFFNHEIPFHCIEFFCCTSFRISTTLRNLSIFRTPG